MKKNPIILMLAALLTVSLTACTSTATGTTGSTTAASAANATAAAAAKTGTAGTTAAAGTTATAAAAAAGTPLLTVADLYSTRDLEQTADTSSAKTIEMKDGTDVSITEEGVYVLKGTAKDATVTVTAPDDAKVQIVLDGVSIINADAPAIYVKSGDKVFVTTTDTTSHLETTGTLVADGDTNLDAVIFSRSDITLNGTGTLEIVSAQSNGVSSKDDLKVTGGTYTIKTAADSLEANDAVLLYAGTLTIDSGKDAVHAENEDEPEKAVVHVGSAVLNITAVDDAIQGNSIVQIDGGTIEIATCAEGIESTSVQINGGTISLYATDDGINAAAKTSGDVYIEVNGGTISVKMGAGDTDGFDANGSIRINGGTISVEGNSAFDADNGATLNGGTVTVNGQVVTELATQNFGHGGGGGGMGGGGRGGKPGMAPGTKPQQ